jgi:hypothetical protein
MNHMKRMARANSMCTRTTLLLMLTMMQFYFQVKHVRAFPDRRQNRWANSQDNPRASAAIPAPVFSGHFAVAAGIVAEEIAAAEADAQTVAVTGAEAAAIAAGVVTAGAEDLNAGPAGVAAADSIAVAADVLDTAIPVDTDTRGGHN